MKLFKIYRNDKADISWDEYLGFIVSAPDEATAKQITQKHDRMSKHSSRSGEVEGHGLIIGNEYFDRSSFCIECDDYWTNDANAQVNVEVLSNDSNVGEGVIMSSFHAG